MLSVSSIKKPGHAKIQRKQEFSRLGKGSVVCLIYKETWACKDTKETRIFTLR